MFEYKSVKGILSSKNIREHQEGIDCFMNKILEKIKIGMSREEIKNLLGEPDDIGGGSRKYPIPPIWLYGDIEFHFMSSRYDENGRGYSFSGPLVFVMQNHNILLK